MVNEDEYEIEINKKQAIEIVVAAKAVDSVMNPQNNNFYANESRYSQVAYWMYRNQCAPTRRNPYQRLAIPYCARHATVNCRRCKGLDRDGGALSLGPRANDGRARYRLRPQSPYAPIKSRLRSV